MKILQNKILILAILVIVLILGTRNCRHVTVQYRVVDDRGTPVPDAKITAGYSTGGDWSLFSHSEHIKKGITNREGYYRYSAFVPLRIEAFLIPSVAADIFSKIEKEGYYSVYGPVVKNDDITKGKWKNQEQPLLITLKRRVRPVPMHSKAVRLKLPNSVGAFGYDLVVGDLVKPYGIGEINDLIFHVAPADIVKNKKRDLSFDITFSNKGDGIQTYFVQYRNAQRFENKAAKFDYHAPTSDYLPRLVMADSEWQNRYEEEVNYYIKVRSRSDGSAMYGWISGIFRASTYSSDGKPNVEFEYALNPDRTTNVEFRRWE